jgi:Fe-Mn family superoxide dismutase
MIDRKKLHICNIMKQTEDHSRRAFIKTGAVLAFGGMIAPSFANHLPYGGQDFSGTHADLKFELPPLPYEYDALEPFIDKQTMQIHHVKHHAAYVENLNKAIAEEKKVPGCIESILAKVSKFPKAIRNNGGGHYNHSMFWRTMKPNGGGQPTGALADSINSSFGSFEQFKTKFNENATKHFGSGWTWLALRKGKLEIGDTDNQDNPLMDVSDFRGIPILGLDVWEHAYYLKHQNKRADYISAWWNVINWEEVSRNFANAK